MDVKREVLEYFSAKGEIPGATPAKKLACSYVSAGLLDSMQIVELILAMESRFGIKFIAEEMQSEEFFTIGGLIVLIERRLAAEAR